VNRLGAPPVLAALAMALAAVSHPALAAERWLPAHAVALPALALLTAVSLVMRCGWRVAAGAAALVLGLAYDSVRGYTGSVTLRPGQATRTFEEEGPGGKVLGFRPFGFDMVLQQLGPGAEAALTSSRGRARVSPGRAASLGGVRFGNPRLLSTGEAVRLRLAVARGGTTTPVELEPGRPAQVGELAIALDQYFPDFALDEKGQPFSRSREARNPAALLQVRRGGKTWRVFVIRSLPGIHQLEGLDETFSLLDVETEQSVQLRVARQPAAWLVAAGLLLLAVTFARPQ
jgi:hypothetical protein